jgi:alanine racemase
MEYNEIKVGDDITVINEKLKTDKYANLSNAEIAEALTEIGISIDMNNFKIHDGQIVSR